MPRARYTQAEVARALRAAREAGAGAVELPGGIVIRLDAPPPPPAPSKTDAGEDETCDRLFGVDRS